MKNRMLTDSIALASVKIFTMITGILSTMILSKTLPLESYGTYSTGNLIITTATLISAFGLIDALNYYYNSKSENERNDYINTIFFLIAFCGITVGIIILCTQKLLTNYFHNSMLGMIYAYIAFRPFLQNSSLGLQILQVSIGKAKIVAIRNAIISVVKLASIIVTSVYTKNILTIFVCMLLVEGASLIFYYKILKNNKVSICPFKPNLTIIREILIFCIPMGIYIQTNALSRDLDKYVIGFFEKTEMLAVYTNCSTKLPFDMISGSLVVLLIPLLTRCIQEADNENGTKLFCCYLKIGYIFTLSFGIATIIVSSQAVQFLYGAKYLIGIDVFILYIIVDMINFISYSLVLSAKGRTKDLMVVSCSALFMNVIINYVFYRMMGFVGPAVATVIITTTVSFVLLRKSANILNRTITQLLDYHHLAVFGTQLIILSVIFSFVKNCMERFGINYFLILVVVGGSFVALILLMNLNELKKCFKLLNNINKEKMKK